MISIMNYYYYYTAVVVMRSDGDTSVLVWAIGSQWTKRLAEVRKWNA
jgi:hypothetical protein